MDIITGWESEIDHNDGEAKVPTRISYSQYGNVSSWGFDHDAQDRQLAWFKILLCEEAKRRAEPRLAFLNQLEEDMGSLGKEPVDVAADYLHRLWSHATTLFKSRFGEVFFENLQIKFVLTVPAIWDHRAQELTKEAAVKAGMMSRNNMKLELVSEPEAAARFVFNNHLSLKVGDAFVVCDAGGGTVDLISYQVEELTPLRLKMCCEATGGLFGAVFLDTAFERTVKSSIGTEAFSSLSARNKKKMMADWEHGLKRTFKHGYRPDRDWVVDIPGYAGRSPSPPPYSPALTSASASSSPLSPRSTSNHNRLSLLTPQTTGSTIRSMRELSLAGRRGTRGGEPGVTTFKTTDLEGIFGEVCPRVVRLVGEQIDSLTRTTALKPKAIFLVGGFGANKYLKEELGQSFPNIEIQQPRDA